MDEVLDTLEQDLIAKGRISKRPEDPVALARLLVDEYTGSKARGGRARRRRRRRENVNGRKGRIVREGRKSEERERVEKEKEHGEGGSTLSVS